MCTPTEWYPTRDGYQGETFSLPCLQREKDEAETLQSGVEPAGRGFTEALHRRGAEAVEAGARASKG